MHLVEHGRLHLDDKVFGPQGILDTSVYRISADPRYADITVRQLLSHSAGFYFVFPADPIFQTFNIAVDAGLTPPTYSPEVIIQWALKNVTLHYTPGTSATYTNFAFVILGEVLHRITGIPYNTFVRDSIFAPLNIRDVNPGKTLPQDRLPNEVSYYEYPGAPLSTSIFTGIPNSAPAPYGGYNWEIMTAAGGWVASAQDLCRLLVAVDGSDTKRDILLRTSIDTMSHPSTNWPAYGLGWNLGGNDYYHLGGIQGTASEIHVNRANELTWSIIYNTLPKDYAPLYTDFTSLVLNAFPTITSWPTHDLWDDPSDVDVANGSVTNNANVFPIGSDIAHNAIVLSPNPTSDDVCITFTDVHSTSNHAYTSTDKYIKTVDVYSTLGEHVLHINASPESQRVVLSVGEYVTGTYLVRVSAGGEQRTRVLIVR